MKASLKALTCILLLTAAARTCSAQVVLYNYTQQQTTTPADKTQNLRLSGQLLWDLATTNVALVTWIEFGSAKNYFVQPATLYAAVPIHRPGQSALTALGPSMPGLNPSDPTQYLGEPLLGHNSHLKIGTNKFVDLPSVLTSANTTVSYNLQDESGNRLLKFSQRCVFAAAATQAANNQGQSLDDALTALVQSLQARGYSGH